MLVHFEQKKKTYHLVFISTLILVGVVYFSTQFEEVDLSLYNEPIVLSAKEVAESDSLTGIWEGVHGYYHDCNGCETRNRIWLSVGNNFNVVMIEAIDVFTQLYHVPLINKTYGNPEQWIVQATNFKIRGECLVEVYFEPVDSSALAHFNDYYQGYNCELEPDDYPLSAYKFERKGEKLILTP
jgi:hypothetical protein